MAARPHRWPPHRSEARSPLRAACREKPCRLPRRPGDGPGPGRVTGPPPVAGPPPPPAPFNGPRARPQRLPPPREHPHAPPAAAAAAPAPWPLPPEGVRAVPRKLSRAESGPERGPVAAAIGRRSRYPRRDAGPPSRPSQAARPARRGGQRGAHGGGGCSSSPFPLPPRPRLLLAGVPRRLRWEGAAAEAPGAGPGSPVGGSSPVSRLLPWEPGWDVPRGGTCPPLPSEVWVRGAGARCGGGGAWLAAEPPPPGRGPPGARRGRGAAAGGCLWAAKAVGGSPPGCGAGAGAEERSVSLKTKDGPSGLSWRLVWWRQVWGGVWVPAA